MLLRWCCIALVAVIALSSSHEATACARRQTVRRGNAQRSADVTRPATASSPAAQEQLPPPSATPRIDPQQALADIMALRQAQGLADPETDSEFAGALQRLIHEKHGQGTVTIEPVAPIVRSKLETDADSAVVDHLRQSAAHFDSVANDLERRKVYAEADAARHTAEALRREARRLDP